jgi:hypothetical protein
VQTPQTATSCTGTETGLVTKTAIDDFGAGDENVEFLKHMPVRRRRSPLLHARPIRDS